MAVRALQKTTYNKGWYFKKSTFTIPILRFFVKVFGSVRRLLSLKKKGKSGKIKVMENKDSFILVRKVVTSDKYFIDACLLEDTCVVCINRENKKNKDMPFKVMYENNNLFWLQNETWEYFFSQEEIDKIKERIAQFISKWEQPVVVESGMDKKDNAVNKKSDQGWGNECVDFASLPEEERIVRMEACKQRLAALIAQKPRQEQLVTEALVETTKDAVLNNYASLMNTINLASEDAKKQTQELVESTRELVKASSQLISGNIFHDELMHTLVSKSDGTIIQHMTRVYLKGLAFLSYYNKLVSSSSVINKLRVSFTEKYHDFYQALLPHVYPEDITLERVFLGGMRAIPEQIFYNWATGFLLHDIGKAAAVDYHEGEASYDPVIVQEHVNVGYTSIMNKTNYPKDAALITGYHHEYYGDPSGYGYYRTSLEQCRKLNPQIKQDFCITYDLEPMMEYEALGFFPAKLLEIVDVYDALTDPNRKYRKALTAEEALKMMEDEFVKKHPKIDIILYDLFAKFVREAPAN
jgi:CRISPR/Cas system-associated endoribonuclease Cas2